MDALISFLLEPYVEASLWRIILEVVAALFGVLSVFYARRENILVFPTGIVSTIIYVYLLMQWQLYGDLIINVYYTIMSVYGWYMWSKVLKTNTQDAETTAVSRSNTKERLKAFAIFFSTFVFVVLVYRYHNVMPNTMGWSDSWHYFIQHLTSGSLADFRLVTPFIDSVTTGVFFAGMWLMANKKIENWTLWILGDLISIPLYLVKGYGFTALQYAIFMVLAILAYFNWRKLLNKRLSQEAAK